MAKLALALLITLAGVLGFSNSVTASTGSRVQYQTAGWSGVLSIADAEGQSFSAIDANGVTVIAGVVPNAHFSLPVPHSGPDSAGILLHVTVGSGYVGATGLGGWWECD